MYLALKASHLAFWIADILHPKLPVSDISHTNGNGFLRNREQCGKKVWRSARHIWRI
jgi:hypothetical protein